MLSAKGHYVTRPEMPYVLWRQVVRSVILVLVSLVFSSEALSASELAKKPISIVFKDYFGKPTSSRPPDSWFWFGAIPGAIFGGSVERVKVETIGDQDEMALDFAELQALAARRAEPLNSDAIASGWIIFPSDTQIVRLATNLIYADARKHPFNTGFIDEATGNSLLLVYFDRPCRLTGTIFAQHSVSGTQAYRVDVTVDKAGLTWIQSAAIPNSTESSIRVAPRFVRPAFVAQTVDHP